MTTSDERGPELDDLLGDAGPPVQRFHDKPLRKGTRGKHGRSYCGRPDCPGPGRCPACHTAYVRAWRRAGRERTPDGVSRIRSAAMRQVAAALRDGRLERRPCEFTVHGITESWPCGRNDVDPYIEDYRRPLAVRWLCRPHRRAAEKLTGRD